MLSVGEIEGVRSEVARIQHELHDLKQDLRNGREKLKQQKQLSRHLTSLFRENEKSAEETIASQNRRTSVLEDERKGLLKDTQSLQKEISRLKSEINKVHRSNADRLEELEDEQQTTLQRLQSEFAKDRAQLTESLESKIRQLDEYASTIGTLEAEAREHKRQLQVAKALEKGKQKEVQALLERADGANAEWHLKMEREKERIHRLYESLLATLKAKNRELRQLCSKTNESISQTEGHNQELVKRSALLERENEQLRQRIDSDKDEVLREKQLVERKARAVEIQNEVKNQAEIEELKKEFEHEKRSLFAFLAKQFSQFFDGRQNLTADNFKAVVVQASSELKRMTQEDAAIRRLLHISVDESAEEAVAKLLLSLNRH
jgi:chromosome segregation ATPase